MDWNSKAPAWVKYEQMIEATSAAIKVDLLHRANIQSGQDLLDIGCGSGGTTLAIAEMISPSGSVLGADIADAMIARAKDRMAAIPQATFSICDVAHFNFEPHSADTAISCFGMMFFENPNTAFENILTAMRPAGEIHFVAWAAAQHNPWFNMLQKAASNHLRDLPIPAPNAPGPMAFADCDRVINLMAEAGWQNASADTVDIPLTPTGSAEEIAEMVYAFGPFGDLMEARGIAAADKSKIEKSIVSEVADTLQSFHNADGFHVPAKVHFFSAQKPA